eukprot:UC1_evm4s707
MAPTTSRIALLSSGVQLLATAIALIALATPDITAAVCATTTASSSSSSCPNGFTMVESAISAEGGLWAACEDLSAPAGAIVLVPIDDNNPTTRYDSAAAADEVFNNKHPKDHHHHYNNNNNSEDGYKSAKRVPVWLPKTYEPFRQGIDDDYYLGLGKTTVLNAKWDMLGQSILHNCSVSERYGDFCEPTWQRVERAVPVMRYSGGNQAARSGGPSGEWMCSPYYPESGVRTFVGSRSASVDATFSDHADDCTDNGFPRPQSYVMNLTAIAHGEPGIHDFITYVNFTGMADGMVGGVIPNVIFYFPILPQNFSGYGTGHRYWTMIASPVPDMQGGREQSVWFRFQQLVCPANAGWPSYKSDACKLRGKPQYYDTYWYSSNPITERWIRPELAANASGFYANILATVRYWDNTLSSEGMMQLSLPDTPGCNGTWLAQQAVGGLVRNMISRDNTWHPRYGVLPGYGVSLQDGFEDVETNTAYAALEIGAIPYAKGVIDNWLTYYIRDNGMTTYRAEELAQAGRTLSIFAHYVSYTGDSSLMLKHFGRARGLAQWLLYRYNISLTRYHADDPRFGIPPGGDEGDTYIGYYASYGDKELPHMYSCAGNIYRGFEDIGEMWTRVGHATGRNDVVAHGTELLTAAPRLRAHIQASLNRTMFKTGNPVAPRCVPPGADANANLPGQCSNYDFRAYPELLYSGVLTDDQVEDVYRTLSLSNNSFYYTRPMTMGCCGYNNKQTTYTAYGVAYGMLKSDMVERFLLHYFAMSAHTYTRGTWTTPEASHPDRDVASTDFVSAGVVTATTYLKWALVFEEPDSRCVWLAKALPREWLAESAAPVKITNATTRYGRISYTLNAAKSQPSQIGKGGYGSGKGGGVYTVTASVSLPASYATSPPKGGVRLRVRAPNPYARKMSFVTVGGTKWTAIDVAAETIDFKAETLTPSRLKDLAEIVITFA